MKIAVCELNGRTGREAGRELLERLYREETGAEMPEIRIQERGKPFFADSEWHFSISHTHRHCFCALSRKKIGIDAEELDRQMNLKLADKILSSEERAQFDAAEDQRTALLTFWVLKEAAAKLTGEGLRGYPNHTKFSLEDPRVRLCHGCLLAVMEEGEEYAL